MVGERREHLAQLHRLSLALGPPFLAVEAIAGEQNSQPNWRFAGDFTPTRDIAPHVKRLQPRERHGNTEAAKHRAAREFMIAHIGPPSNGSSRPLFTFARKQIRHSSNSASIPRISRNCLLCTIVANATPTLKSFADRLFCISANSGSSESCTDRPRE